MTTLKKIKHKEFIVNNEFDLDEIIRKYGKTGDEIEEHISGIINLEKTQITRTFSRVEYLGTIGVTKSEYDSNKNNSQYRFFEDNNGIHYTIDEYEVEYLTEEAYKNEAELYSSEFHYCTTINYIDFLNRVC
jgi:hypothetical protein